MVNVVAPKGSPQAIINLGLTIKELQKIGRNGKPVLADEPEQFWNNLDKYVDESDKSLIILDMPHPKAGKSRPVQAAVIYIPSELNAPNIEERQTMLENGISVVPERKSSECFLGDLTKENKKWRDISSIISLEPKPKRLNEEQSSIIRGIVDVSQRSLSVAVDKVAEDDMYYFRKLGSETKRKSDLKVVTENGLCEIEIRANSQKDIGEIFEAFLSCEKDPVIIKGVLSGIFTIKPSLVEEIAASFKSKLKPIAIFGKASLLSPETIAYENLLFLAGKADRDLITLKIAPPKYVSDKTLRRWLVGGETSEAKEGGKKYRKTYHGLKENFPGLKFLAKNILSVPGEAYENTIARLHESGSEFQILEEKQATTQAH